MTRTNFYTTEAGIASQIGNLPLGTGRVALVGGHYLLLYERKSDSLKPAIYQDFNDLGNKIFSKKLGQNFPVKSFELSVQLYLQFRRSGVACKNVLLVNDDSFLRKDFRTEEHYELIKDRGFELRRNYFASNENIPDIYKSILRKFSLSTADFFSDFVNEQTGEDNLLPTKSVFVSERRLCRRFKKTVKAAGGSDKLFRIVNMAMEGADNINELTVDAGRLHSLCLIKEGVCNCGGKAFQFFYDLLKRGYETIIFFVPDECRAQVDEGTRLICNAREFEARKIQIINITDIGANPEEPEPDKEVTISYYSNQLQHGQGDGD